MDENIIDTKNPVGDLNNRPHRRREEVTYPRRLSTNEPARGSEFEGEGGAIGEAGLSAHRNWQLWKRSGREWAANMKSFAFCSVRNVAIMDRGEAVICSTAVTILIDKFGIHPMICETGS